MRPPAASKIIAQTDFLGAIHALTGTIKRARSVRQFAAVVTAYQQKIAASGIEVEFRHVSGHRGTVTPRNAVNTWCDAECHRLMRQARAALLTPEAASKMEPACTPNAAQPRAATAPPGRPSPRRKARYRS
jgi:hypothetical protein